MLSDLCPSPLSHSTVLLTEAVDALAITDARKEGIYVDGTFGRGGHSLKILEQLGSNGRLIAFDKDFQAIVLANAVNDQRFLSVHESFANLKTVLHQHGITQIDGMLLDLGVSSPQLEEAIRGFSFRMDGPLDMRMDTTRGLSAAEWLAKESEQKIGEVIKNYGEERFAFQIAKAIVARRTIEPVSGTLQLAKIVAAAVKTHEKGKNPATRTFQAIRIFINKELEELEAGLESIYQVLAPYGRLAVISFHSLEDRIVKQFIARKSNIKQPDRRLPILAKDLLPPDMQILGRFKPSAAEIVRNPRARSAIMRVAQKLPASTPLRNA